MAQKFLYERITRRPRALAAGCVAALAAILALEILTPNDLVAGAALLPLIAAMWALPNRLAIVVAAAGALFFTAALVFEQRNRLSISLVAVPTLAAAGFVRLNAAGFARALIGEQPSTRIRPTIVAPLTGRQLEVARLAACAYTAAEIARELHIGERTVESHIGAAYLKLGIRSRSELIRMAPRLG